MVNHMNMFVYLVRVYKLIQVIGDIGMVGFDMIQENASNDVIILSIDEARARGLAPRTVAGLSDLLLHVGDGSRRMRYIDC
jgi:hypothetical protein